MPPDDPPRTLLALRLRERGLTVERFVREFNKAARRAGPDSRDHAISYRQATRWVSGNIPSLPYPVSCRVLETMFGDDAASLVESATALPSRKMADAALLLGRLRRGRLKHPAPFVLNLTGYLANLADELGIELEFE